MLNFSDELWYKAIDKSINKGINKLLLTSLHYDDYKYTIWYALYKGEYKFEQPRIGYVLKLDGSKRKVFINTPIDRVIFSFLALTLEKEYGHLLSENVYSYRTGYNVATVLKEVTKVKGNWVGVKLDLTKYFDSVPPKIIEQMLNTCTLGEGVDKCIRDYMFTNLPDGTYKSLGQGSATSAFYSNIILSKIDDSIEELFNVKYFRYADDILIIGDNWKDAFVWLETQLLDMELKINSKKTSEVSYNTPFEYLGFTVHKGNICASKLTRKLIREIVDSSGIKKYNDKTLISAIKKINKKLFSESNYIKNVFNSVNNKENIHELGLYLKDCIRRCYTGKTNNYHNNKVLPNEKLQGLGLLSMTRCYIAYKIDPQVMYTLYSTQKYLDTKEREYKGNIIAGDINLHKGFIDLYSSAYKTNTEIYNISNDMYMPVSLERLLDEYDEVVESYGTGLKCNFSTKSFNELERFNIILEQKEVLATKLETDILEFVKHNKDLFDDNWALVTKTSNGNKLVLIDEWSK